MENGKGAAKKERGMSLLRTGGCHLNDLSIALGAILSRQWWLRRSRLESARNRGQQCEVRRENRGKSEGGREGGRDGDADLQPGGGFVDDNILRWGVAAKSKQKSTSRRRRRRRRAQ